jgi:hypothetical protein
MSTIPSGILPTRSRGGYSGREAHVVFRRESDLRRTGRFGPGIFPLLGCGPVHHTFSEFFDWNDLLLFKNFLRIDGCAEQEKDPPSRTRSGSRSVSKAYRRFVAPLDPGPGTVSVCLYVCYRNVTNML